MSAIRRLQGVRSLSTVCAFSVAPTRVASAQASCVTISGLQARSTGSFRFQSSLAKANVELTLAALVRAVGTEANRWRARSTCRDHGCTERRRHVQLGGHHLGRTARTLRVLTQAYSMDSLQLLPVQWSWTSSFRKLCWCPLNQRCPRAYIDGHQF
eukprot:SAG31_NODE_4751_length_2970_cov_3.171240_2_plen_156_part_00